MTDIRQALEEAYEAVFGQSAQHDEWYSKSKAVVLRATKFNKMLRAEAWTDAAMCLVPEGWLWRIMPSDVQGHWLSEVWTDDTDDCEFAARAKTPAHALLAACLKAKDQADG